MKRNDFLPQYLSAQRSPHTVLPRHTPSVPNSTIQRLLTPNRAFLLLSRNNGQFDAELLEREVFLCGRFVSGEE
jgi:hypothetical protein